MLYRIPSRDYASFAESQTTDLMIDADHQSGLAGREGNVDVPRYLSMSQGALCRGDMMGAFHWASHAEDALKKRVQEDSARAGQCIWLSEIYARCGDLSAATSVVTPEFVEAEFGITRQQARISAMAGEYRSAVSLIEMALAEKICSDEDRSDAMLDLALYFEFFGDFESEHDILREWLKTTNQQPPHAAPDIQLRLARSLTNLGRFDESNAVLQELQHSRHVEQGYRFASIYWRAWNSVGRQLVSPLLAMRECLSVTVERDGSSLGIYGGLLSAWEELTQGESDVALQKFRRLVDAPPATPSQVIDPLDPLSSGASLSDLSWEGEAYASSLADNVGSTRQSLKSLRRRWPSRPSFREIANEYFLSTGNGKTRCEQRLREVQQMRRFLLSTKPLNTRAALEVLHHEVRLLIETERLDEAETIIKCISDSSLAAEDTTVNQCRVSLAEAMERKGRFEEALIHFDAVVQSGGMSVEETRMRLRGRTGALRCRRHNMSAETYRATIDGIIADYGAESGPLQDDAPELLLLLAELEAERASEADGLGFVHRADAAFQEQIPVTLNDFENRFLLADLWGRLMRPQRAIRAVDDALSHCSDRLDLAHVFWRLTYAKARFLAQSGEYKLALNAMDELAPLDQGLLSPEEYLDALAFQAKCCEFLGLFFRAADIYSRLYGFLSRDPQTSEQKLIEVAFDNARNFELSGESVQAADIYNEIVQVVESRPSTDPGILAELRLRLTTCSPWKHKPVSEQARAEQYRSRLALDEAIERLIRQ